MSSTIAGFFAVFDRCSSHSCARATTAEKSRSYRPELMYSSTCRCAS